MGSLIALWLSTLNTHLAEQGQDLTEYAFLVALIAIIVAVAILSLAPRCRRFTARSALPSPAGFRRWVRRNAGKPGD